MVRGKKQDRCSWCKDKGDKYEQWVCCDKCSLWYHLRCQDNITEELYNLLNAYNEIMERGKDSLKMTTVRMMWTCKTCEKAPKTEAQLVADGIQAISRKIDRLTEDTFLSVNRFAALSYSDVAGGANVKQKPREFFPRLIVKPTITQESKISLEDVNKIVMAKGAKVTKKYVSKDGTIKLDCWDEKSMKLVEEGLKANKNYNLELPKMLMPRLKVVNLNEDVNDLDEIELAQSIISQNGLPDSSSVVVHKRYQNNKTGLYTVIIEVDPLSKIQLLRGDYQKVFIATQRAKIYEYVGVRRCGKCLKFSHGTVECQSEQVCTKCSQTGHVSKDCKNDKHCLNCHEKNLKFPNLKIKSDHIVTDNQCPCYMEIVKNIKGRIMTH